MAWLKKAVQVHFAATHLIYNHWSRSIHSPPPYPGLLSPPSLQQPGIIRKSIPF